MCAPVSKAPRGSEARKHLFPCRIRKEQKQREQRGWEEEEEEEGKKKQAAKYVHVAGAQQWEKKNNTEKKETEKRRKSNLGARREATQEHLEELQKSSWEGFAFISMGWLMGFCCLFLLLVCLFLLPGNEAAECVLLELRRKKPKVLKKQESRNRTEVRSRGTKRQRELFCKR